MWNIIPISCFLFTLALPWKRLPGKCKTVLHKLNTSGLIIIMPFIANIYVKDLQLQQLAY